MRPRREVAPRTVTLLTPLFRYSYSRDAYILRGIGGKRGPVLRVQTTRPVPAGTDRDARFSREEQLTGRR